MITIENVTLFVCEFCKKRLIKSHAMLRHEDFCSRNPKNFSACGGCVFLKEKRETVDYYYGDEGYSKGSKSFHCSKLDKRLYPFKVVRMGLLKKYPDTFKGQEQMPVKCEHWSHE